MLFVGINPGVRSAQTGHHFAGYSNRFWKLLFAAGLIRIGEAANRITSGASDRAVAHATSGPALQQNLLCTLEGGR